MRIDLFGLVQFEIAGTASPILTYVEHEYGSLQTAARRGTPDLYVELVEDKVDPARAMRVRGPVSYDSRGVFLHDPQYRALRIDFETLGTPGARITCDKDFNPHFFAVVIDYLIHFHVLRHNAFLCHASAFELDGRGILCPAWRNVGKTNLLLEALDNGARYLADDWVLVHEGQLIALPKRLNLLYYNFQAFPGLIERASDDLRALVEFIRAAEGGVYDVNEDVLVRLRDQARWRIGASDLFGRMAVRGRSGVDAVFALRRVVGEDKVVLHRASQDELVSMVGAILRFEQSYFYLYYDAVKGRTGIRNDLVENADLRTERLFAEAIRDLDVLYVIDVPSQDSSGRVREVIWDVLSQAGDRAYPSPARLEAVARKRSADHTG